MSQWKQAIDLGLWNSIWNYYRQVDFPIEIRFHLAHWLEYWACQIDPNNEIQVSKFASLLQKELENTISNMNIADSNNLLRRQQLTELLMLFPEKYGNDPGRLLQTIVAGLEEERTQINNILFQQSGSSTSASTSATNLDIQTQSPSTIMQLQIKLASIVPNPGRVVNNGQTRLGDCKGGVEEVKNITDHISDERENISLLEREILENSFAINGVLNQQQRHAQLSHHQNMFSHWIQRLQESFKSYTKLTDVAVRELHAVILGIFGEIENFKEEQRLYALGYSMPKSLDKIAELSNISAEGLLEIFKNQNSVKECFRKEFNCFLQQQQQEITMSMTKTDQDVWGILQDMVHKTFIVEVQPPLVVRLKAEIKVPKYSVHECITKHGKSKPEKHSPVKSRLLIGPTICKHSAFKVKVGVLFEDEAAKFHKNPSYIPKISGKMSDNSKKDMSYDKATNSFHVEFNKLKIMERPTSEKVAKIPGSASKKEDLIIASEKYWLYFSSQLCLKDLNDLSVTLKTTSRGFTAASHPYQDKNAWPHSLFLNAFPGRNDVSIDELFKVLSKLFQKHTLRGLSEENIAFLRQKLLKGYRENQKSTWELFQLEEISDCFENPVEAKVSRERKEGSNTDKEKKKSPISFANWLFAIMKCCQPSENGKDNGNIRQEWASGYVTGFISREDTEMKLKNSDLHTIIIRFADTLLEGVTVMCYNHANGTLEKFGPCQPDDLKMISLSQRILDKSIYKFIYPNHPKQVLRRNFTELQDKRMEMLSWNYIVSTLKEVDIHPRSWNPEHSQRDRERQNSSSSSFSSFGTSSTSGTHQPFSPQLSIGSVGSPAPTTSFSGSESYPSSTSQRLDFGGGQSFPISSEFDWGSDVNLMDDFDHGDLISEIASSGITQYPSSSFD